MAREVRIKVITGLSLLGTTLVLIASGSAVSPAAALPQAQGEPEILAMMQEMNARLAEMGLGVAVEQIDLYTIGQGRPSNRIHAQPFRWVAADPRRLAQGIDVTYIVDQSAQGGSLLPLPATEGAQDAAMATWDAAKPLKKVNVIKRSDPGSDVTFFDGLVGFGDFNVGNPFAADIVFGGFPNIAPIFGPNVLAFSVTFIFVSGGVPTDINGDNRLDTALNEVYFSDAFMWDTTGLPTPFFDIETVGLHEAGHSLGIGHFGPPPSALMNPSYAGLNRSPDSADNAGMAGVWASWPQ